MVFLIIHIAEAKNDIAHLQACKWFFQFTCEKKRNDIAKFVGSQVVFFIHIVGKKNDIAHL